MKKIVLIVGTRPNFIKALCVYKELQKKKLNLFVLHTGQHYSHCLNSDIYRDIGLPIHDNLRIQSSNRSTHVLNIESKLKELNPRLVIVFGDVNSTLAGAWAAKRLDIPIAHVESGLRSHNWQMEEEINRYFTDAISDYCFVTEDAGIYNLNREFNCTHRQVFLVGNTQIDTLHKFRKQICIKSKKKGYIVATFHRKETISSKKEMTKIVNLINEISSYIPVHLYAHPHLQYQLISHGKHIHFENPLPYKEFLRKVYNANYVITDSGGLQQEATYLSTPCVTYRNETENKLSLEYGNILTKNHEKIMNLIQKKQKKKFEINQELKNTLWGDGKASERVVDKIRVLLNEK